MKTRCYRHSDHPGGRTATCGSRRSVEVASGRFTRISILGQNLNPEEIDDGARRESACATMLPILWYVTRQLGEIAAVESLLRLLADLTSVTSCNLPVSTSKMQPRTGMSLAIQGRDLTFLICSRAFCSGSLYEKKRIGAGEASPVEALSFAFSSSS